MTDTTSETKKESPFVDGYVKPGFEAVKELFRLVNGYKLERDFQISKNHVISQIGY